MSLQSLFTGLTSFWEHFFLLFLLITRMLTQYFFVNVNRDLHNWPIKFPVSTDQHQMWTNELITKGYTLFHS